MTDHHNTETVVPDGLLGRTSNQRERRILALTIFAVLFAQVLLYPGITDLVTALGATTQLDASMWFLTAEFAAFVLFAGIWGILSDLTGRRVPFIIVGAFGGALGYAVLALLGESASLTFPAILGLRFVQGTFTIAAFSLAMTMLMDLDGGHGKNMGAAGIAIGSGTALGAPLGGQLYANGPMTPLWIASATLLLAALLATRVTDRTSSDRHVNVRQVFHSVRRTPALTLPYAFGFVDRLTAGFFALVGTIYFRETFSLDAAGAGIVLGLFFVPFALLQYPLGIASDRIGRKLPVVVGSVLYGGAVLAVYYAPNLPLAGLAMVLLGVFGALVSPATMALVTDLAAETDRGVAMGGFNVFGNLGFLSGFVVGGTVTDAAGFGPAFVTTAVLEAGIVLLVLPILLRLELPPKRTSQGQE